MRQQANYSQEAVAQFLGCSRTRITEIEREESSASYTLGELELLTVLFGQHPLDMLRLAGQDAMELGELMTAKHTHGALLNVVDCAIPGDLAEILRIDEMPGDLVYAPGERLLASIVDSYRAEDWHKDEPCPVSILCWDTRTGRILGQTRFPYAEEIAPLADGRIVIAAAPPQEAYQAWEAYEQYAQLLVWNIYTGQREEMDTLPYPVRGITVSSDGAYLAAYMPAITTIQVWRTVGWQRVQAYELELGEGESDPGFIAQQAADCDDFSRKRKFTAIGFEHRTTRFVFLNQHILVVGFPEQTHEFDVLSPHGYATSPLGLLKEFPRLTHLRNEKHEIAVKTITYDSHADAGDSKVDIYYEVAAKPKRYPPIQEVQVHKWVSGIVRQCVILDETCILAWVFYDTPYRWGRSYKRRIGLVNLISGRVVLLEDQGRWQPDENQMAAAIAPDGKMVAYWTFSADGEPRLALQYLDSSPLCRKGLSLPVALEQSRQRWVEEVTAFQLAAEQKPS